jgi:hypothetical protein
MGFTGLLDLRLGAARVSCGSRTGLDRRRQIVDRARHPPRYDGENVWGMGMALGPRDFGIGEEDWNDKTAAICQATGYYLYWFALVELTISALLAKVLGFDEEYEKIDLLISSALDPRAKVIRLTQAGERYGKPIGETLNAALRAFTDDEGRLRNLMAHAWPVLDESGVIHFTTLGRMPKRLFGSSRTRSLALAPSAYSLKDIYRRARWLKALRGELVRLLRVASDLTELEVGQAILDLRRMGP